jgi:hypothetical protein
MINRLQEPKVQYKIDFHLTRTYFDAALEETHEIYSTSLPPASTPGVSISA